MSLLNSTYHMIDTYRDHKLHSYDQTKPSTGLALLMSDFAERHDIWYCMITTPESITAYPFRELIGLEILNKIQNKKAFLVIDLPFEPFYKCIDNVYKKLVIQEDIPASQIIFMSNMYDAPAYNKQAAEQYNCQPINTFYFSALEYMLSQHINSTYKGLLGKFYPKKLNKFKEYSKKFINLNRRWRMHRPMMVLLLWYKKLLDKGYVSFGPAEDDNRDNWDYIWDMLRVNASTNQELFNIVIESEEIKKMPYLYLDVQDLHMNQAGHSRSTDFYYENSYFSLVSETTYYHKETTQNSRFLTEKTFKAIAMKHPFILATIPKSLEVLHKLGYKTFAPYIDESYDQEMDDNKRMLMIANEVEKLCNLSKEELNAFIEFAMPICEHNYNLLRNRKTFIYRDYLDAL